MGNEEDVLDLLCACLRFDADPQNASELSSRIATVGWENLLSFADSKFLGSVLVRAVVRLDLVPKIPMVTLPDGRLTITKLLQQREASHMGRRTVLTERLAEIVDALNGQRIVSVVLKGGASIATGHPDWRYLRDLDLLVPPDKAARAQDIVMALGYRPFSQPRPRMVHHHMHELYRDDMPGWIEIHRRAGVSRVEQFLPSEELRIASVPIREGPVSGARVLPPHLHVLHGIVHHHIGHRAVKRAEIDLRGLYEFAAGVTEMSDEVRRAMVERAARHPRLLAILDLWTAAANDLLAMPVEPPLMLADDAMEWWQKMRGRDEGLVGMKRELQAATEPNRMRRASGGNSLLRRAYWRLSVPLTFFKRPMLIALPGSR